MKEIKHNAVYDIRETAEILKTSPQTLRNRISMNKPMPKNFRLGRRVLFRGMDIIEFIDEVPKNIMGKVQRRTLQEADPLFKK